MVAFGGELVYYRRFALRVPDAKLAGYTRRLFWYALVVVALRTISVAGLALLSTGSAPAPTTKNEVLMIVLAVGTFVLALMMLIGLLWYVRLLVRYRKAFADAIEKRGA
jgi:hypothetical protein